ncbi:glycosyltransferase family 39 protein, partial [bacterium]|nr:glycosyltransferase family 39 protein [bacterium]
LLVYGQYHLAGPLIQDNGIYLLCIGILVTICVTAMTRSEKLPSPKISSRTTCILLFTLILLAIPIKLYHLDSVPYGAHNDEIVKGLQVINFSNDGKFQPFYVANKEFLFFYMLIPFIKFFGISIIGLRALPFTCGLLSVLFTYLLFRRLWGQAPAFCAAGFMAVGLWPGQSSHICERLNAAPLFTAAALFFTIVAIQTTRTWAFILSGLVIGAGMWTFPTFRLIPWATFAIMIYAMFKGTLPVRSGWWRSILAFLAFLSVVSAPLKVNLLETISVFYTKQGHDFKIAQGFGQIWEYASQLLISFNVICVQDMSFTLTNIPLFWWPLGAFLLIGLIYSIIRLPEFESVFIIIWLGAALLPAIASEPTVRRLTAAQPVLFGMIGLGAWISLSGILPVINRKKAWGLIPVFLIVLTAGWNNYSVFTKEIAPKWRIAWEDYWIVEAALDSFNRYEVHLDWIEEEAELPYRYLSYPFTSDYGFYQAEIPQFSVPFRFTPEKDFIYYFRNIPENQKSVLLLEELYPEGVLILHQDQDHPRGYYSFSMRKDDLENRRGIIISTSIPSVGQAGNQTINQSIGYPVFDFSPDEKPLVDLLITHPLIITINGILLAENHGQYFFHLGAPGGTGFFVDDQLIEPGFICDNGTNYSIMLTAGPHEIKVITPKIQSWPNMCLRWQTPEIHGRPRQKLRTPWQTIPSANWMRPPFPGNMVKPMPLERASFQYELVKTNNYPHPASGRSYDIARIEMLSDESYIGNCWHYKTIVHLNSEAEITSEWQANLLDDPNWAIRFDYDVGPDGNLYIIGDTRGWLLITTPEGQLIRKIQLPHVPMNIQVCKNNSAIILCHRQVLKISTLDGSVQTKIGQWGDGAEDYNTPIAIAIDAHGNYYVADQSFNRIQVYAPDGKWQRSLQIPGPLSDSIGITFDNKGNLFVPHFVPNFIFCISPEGNLLYGHTDNGCDPIDSAKTRHPRYVFFPDEKSLWITNADLIYILKKK